MAATSVELNPHSRRALNAAAEAGRAAGWDTTAYESALRVLTRPRPPRWSPPRPDKRLRPVYQRYTGGQPAAALRIIDEVRLTAPDAYDNDRLSLLAFRAALLVGNDAAVTAWDDLSATAAPRVVRFGRALALLHNWQFGDALTELERAEAGWRKHRRGVPFLEWHKALARLGLCAETSSTRLAPVERANQFDQAVSGLALAADCYERPPAQARRLFGNGSVPSELAYEPRAYNEESKYVLLDVWTFVAHLAAGRSVDADPAELFAATDRCAREDLLLRWCAHLVRLAAPSAGPSRPLDLEQEFYDLLAVTKSSPGLLRELATMYSLAVGTGNHAYADQLRAASPPPIGI